MDLPNIVTPYKDPVTGIDWQVAAYRKLSIEEAAGAVKFFLRSQKLKRRPIKEKTYKILTTIGARDD